MSVGAVLCRCYALRLAVDGNGIIFVCWHPRRLLRRVRVCKQRPPPSLSHFWFFGRVAERGGRIDCWRSLSSCRDALAISVHTAHIASSIRLASGQRVGSATVVSDLRVALGSRWQWHHLRFK